MPFKASFFRKCVYLFVFSITISACNSALMVQGDKELSFLKDQHLVALEYDYSDCLVDGEPEEEYVKAEMNKRKDSDGEKTAKEWKKDWYGNKELFHNTFTGKLKERIAPAELMIPDEEKQKEVLYLMVLDVEELKTGFYGGPASESPAALFSGAKMKSRLLFLTNDSSRDTLGIMEVDVSSRGEHVTTQNRLNSAYKVAAEHCGDGITRILN